MRRLRDFALLCILLLFIASATLANPLTNKDRIKIFDDVWQTINENYYDPTFNGVDWQAVRQRYRIRIESTNTDEDFYQLLDQMVGELHDAHTRFRTPSERQRRESQQSVSAGLLIYEIEGQSVIVGLNPQSEAARSGVKVGMRVQAIDGIPVATRLAELRTQLGPSSSERAARILSYGGLLQGEPGTKLALELLGSNDQSLTVTITRQQINSFARVSSQRLDSGLGYLKLTRFATTVADEFQSQLTRLQDTSGLIIDLRGNPGGQVEALRQIASFFLPNRSSLGRFVTRSGRPKEVVTSNKDQFYNKPLAVLIDEFSGSAAEIFAGVMQQQGRAIIVGDQSCGCVLGVRKRRKVKGGGELSISELGYLLPKGDRLEGIGVNPDLDVKLTLRSLLRQDDEFIDVAEENLLETIGD